MPEDLNRPGVVATMETLSEADCWHLLATVPVGRLGFVVDDRPQVLPVNFGLDGRTVLFRTAEGTALNEASLRHVAFEADSIDVATQEGWSVLVQGFATDIGDAIDPTSQRIRQLALVTWSPGVRQRWFRVDPQRVTGRRLRVVPDAL